MSQGLLCLFGNLEPEEGTVTAVTELVSGSYSFRVEQVLSSVAGIELLRSSALCSEEKLRQITAQNFSFKIITSVL